MFSRLPSKKGEINIYFEICLLLGGGYHNEIFLLKMNYNRKEEKDQKEKCFFSHVFYGSLFVCLLSPKCVMKKLAKADKKLTTFATLFNYKTTQFIIIINKGSGMSFCRQFVF